ncbi:MAG TPA: SLATT domain-containing protein, partial [Acidimicrobiales bacterium]|nr:SLATT domain-containing protein [Acidimicrobiales bacterium]
LALIGILETVVAAIMTWAGVRAYGPTATAYAFTARELQAIRALGDSAARAEDSWAEFVADAEDAISREHTMWRASRASTSTAPKR